MRPGTPGFVGERLRAAREARGISSASSLAGLLEVSRAAVSQYEANQQTPSPEVMRKICEKLNLPVQYFLRPLPTNDGVLFFRSLASATQMQRTKAKRKYEWLTEIVSFLRGYVQFPKVDFPSLKIPSDPLRMTDDDIEEAASELRKHWGLGSGPISNVAWLIENKGAVTIRLDLDSDSDAMDAFSQWNELDGTPYIILGTNRGTCARSRFNAGHELAHMLLHRNVSHSQISRPGVLGQLEAQANRFAGAFLLPADSFLNDLYSASLDALKEMKLKWKVSVAAMAMRAQSLGAIDESHAKQLWINLARRGWKREEPYDRSLPIESPRFLQRCFGLLAEKGMLQPAAVSASLSLSNHDIRELANLSDEFFEPNPEQDVTEAEPSILRFPKSRMA